jgi:hypothetical protein
LQAGACSVCATNLAIDDPPQSPIGLAFEVRGKLGIGQKRGICVDVDGDSLVLHLSAKEKEPTRLPVTTPPADLVPATHCAATRLLYAADLIDGKLSWDRDLLRRRAAELCSDIRITRRLAEEALTLDWQHIVDWVPLTESEKAWRAAHAAASSGDVELLRSSVNRLPSSG